MLWAIASSLRLVDPHLLVPPATVAATLVQMLGGADYWSAVGSSLARVCGGFVLGGAAGLVVGVVLGVSRIAERIGAPTLHGARSVALFAWIPLLTAWFGDGEVAKVALIALAAFFLGRAYDALGDGPASRRAYEQTLRTLDPADDRYERILQQTDIGDIAAAC
ncbi:MAG: hypothetical protein ABSH03_20885, partial [Candidatus Lustribacter sp.]